MNGSIDLIKRAAGVVLGLSLAACNAGPDRTNIEIFQGMMDQVSVKAQDYDPEREDGLAMRIPPDNTIPQGFEPYAYRGRPLDAERELVNPLAGDLSPEVVELGKGTYRVYCAICHGETGAGDGSVADKMALRPPSLLTEKVVNYRDGRIYHITVEGQGVMGSYASQIRDEQARWAMVNYVRSLQQKHQAQ